MYWMRERWRTWTDGQDSGDGYEKEEEEGQ